MKKQFRVVSITNNPKDYPECVADTEEFPHMVRYVDDEMSLFVVNASDPEEFYPAGEFFHMVTVISMEAEVADD